MFFDQQDTFAVEGLIVFPDWVFAGLPRAEPLIDQGSMQGSSVNNMAIGGSVGDNCIEGGSC